MPHGYKTQNFYVKKKITKREQRAIETLINNSFVKKRVFHHLNERFVSNITRDIIFSKGRNASSNKHIISEATCRRMPKHSTFTGRKNNLVEQRASETLIINYLAKERAFYCLNERFVLNISGDIIFSTRSSERFKQYTSRERLAAWL